MPHPLRNRKIRQKNIVQFDTVNAIHGIVREVITDLRRTPIQIDHVISKVIPEPRTAEIVAVQMDGSEPWRMVVDLSYRHVIPVQIPLYSFTGRQEDISKSMTVRIYLRYDPQRR